MEQIQNSNNPYRVASMLSMIQKLEEKVQKLDKQPWYETAIHHIYNVLTPKYH